MEDQFLKMYHRKRNVYACVYVFNHMNENTKSHGEECYATQNFVELEHPVIFLLKLLWANEFLNIMVHEDFAIMNFIVTLKCQHQLLLYCFRPLSCLRVRDKDNYLA